MTPTLNPRLDPAPPAEHAKHLPLNPSPLDPRMRLGLPNGGKPVPAPAGRTPSHKELESSLEAYFNRAVRLRLGGRTLKVMPTEKGAPDRMVLLPGGRIYLVELKTEVGRTSAAQDLWHERAADLGTRVWVLHGRAEVDRWISRCALAIDRAAGK